MVKSEIITDLIGKRATAWECTPAQRFFNDLFPEEQAYIAEAVEKRQVEFSTARVLARRALYELGVSPQSLCPNDDRSPRWPAGIIGSITHTDG